MYSMQQKYKQQIKSDYKLTQKDKTFKKYYMRKYSHHKVQHMSVT